MKYILTIFLVFNLQLQAQTSATISLNTSAVWSEIDSAFVGFSFNPAYIGMNFSSNYNANDDRTITKNLFNNFYPFQQPSIRINGANNSYWKNTNFNNAPSVFNANASVFNCTYCPSGSPSFSTAIDVNDLNDVQSFTNSLSYKPNLFWGINMTYIDTARVADFCNNITTRFSNNSNVKFELGNEPDAYVSNNRRLNGYDIPAYVSEFNFTANKVKNFGSITGASFAKPNPSSSTSWADSIQYIINNIQSNNVSAISYHTYPLGSASSGTVSGFLNKYLSDVYSNDEVKNYTTGLFSSIKSTQQNGLSFRLGETNTISSGGLQGASDVMGSALWAVDLMFELAKIKGAGVNFAIEGSSTAYYSPFTFNSSQVASGKKVLVNPLYYGCLLFARAAQNKAHIISNSLTNVLGNPNIKVWSVVDKNNVLRVVIINRGNSITDNTIGSFILSLPNNNSNATLYTLSGDSSPSISSNAVTLSGQKVDQNTGLLIGSLSTSSISPNNGLYSVNVAAGSIALIEVTNAGCNCN
ncbi:MAG: hypothetical protein NTZ59_02510 [Bacteroidetes bacterium]|nr:hypothetical protein [Bacteroidota bacterium]